MRALVVCFVALVLAAPVAAASSVAEKRVPGLRLVDREPLVLRGLRFLPRELVRVTVTSEGVRRVKRIRASSMGSFTASFASLALDRCSATLVVASGARGSAARLKLAQPACPPA